MTDVKLKEAFAKLGVNAEDMEKLLASDESRNIVELAARAKTSDEAIEVIAKAFPDVDKEALKAQVESAVLQEEKVDTPAEMSMDELERVAGGTDSDEVGKWIGIAVGIATVVSTVTGVRAYRARRAATAERAAQDYQQGQSDMELLRGDCPELWNS